MYGIDRPQRLRSAAKSTTTWKQFGKKAWFEPAIVAETSNCFNFHYCMKHINQLRSFVPCDAKRRSLSAPLHESPNTNFPLCAFVFSQLNRSCHSIFLVLLFSAAHTTSAVPRIFYRFDAISCFRFFSAFLWTITESYSGSQNRRRNRKRNECVVWKMRQQTVRRQHCAHLLHISCFICVLRWRNKSVGHNGKEHHKP